MPLPIQLAYHLQFLLSPLQRILNATLQSIVGMPPGPDASPGPGPGEAEDRASPYEPSIADVVVVKAMLNKALSLPPELVDTITDYAQYWPHVTAETVYYDTLVVSHVAARFDENEDRFLLRSPPLGLAAWSAPQSPLSPPAERKPWPKPAGEEFSTDDFQPLTAARVPMLAHPCRRIVFTIKSHDQGWGGNYPDRGTYRGSWTWFEVGLERWCRTTMAGTDSAGQQTQQQQRPSLGADDLCTVLPEVEWVNEANGYVFRHPLLPREDLKICCNTTAKREPEVHRVVWSYDDDIDPERDPKAAADLARDGRGTASGNGKFVRELKLGDVVTVWAKARFPGWANYVESVKMDIYFAV